MVTKEELIKVAMPAALAVSVDEVADSAVNSAIAFAAEKLRLPAEAVVAHMREGDSEAASCWRYGLAKRVAECLADWDENVKAVYVVDYDATPEDLAFGAVRSTPVHIIVWVERKTAALDALVAALDGALVRCLAQRLGAKDLAHVLDVQSVDDEDVAARRGYGAALTSLHNRPLRIWAR